MSKKVIFRGIFMLLLMGELSAQNTLIIQDAHLVLESNNLTSLENFSEEDLESTDQTALNYFRVKIKG